MDEYDEEEGDQIQDLNPKTYDVGEMKDIGSN
jgi:hypothetical protein